MVEGVIVLGVLLALVLTILDLGLMVLRRSALTEAACRLARQSIVHGSRAESPWGPQQQNGTVADGTDFATVVRPVLVTLDEAAVSYEITWPDEVNDAGNRVRVALEVEHDPLLPFVLGRDPLVLRAVSTMRIAH